MELTVERKILSDQSTVGELSMDGTFFCYTLEPKTRHDQIKPRAIPAGIYDVTITWSPKHQRFVPLVENVPGFEGIEIHIGNYPRDTEGCLLVGETRAADAVHGSTEAFNKLFARVSAADKQKEKICISYSYSVIAALPKNP